MKLARDNFNAWCSILAAAMDALSAFLGTMLAVWVRFDSGLVPLLNEAIPPRPMYIAAAAVLAFLMVVVFRVIGLYVRPQLGSFGDKLPRIVRGVGVTLATALALSFVVRVEGWPPYSRTVALIAFAAILLLVSVIRFILFRAERHWAKYSAHKRKVLVVGVNRLALHVRDRLQGEYRLRSKVVGFLLPSSPAAPGAAPDIAMSPALSPSEVLGTADDLERVAEATGADEVILADLSVPRSRMADIFFHCERNMLTFRMVPDLYGILTTRIRVDQLADTPLLGIAPWPLERFWNRILKRTEDILGSIVGLLVSAPIIAIAAPFIKRSSPGPVFYSQVRCGIGGRPFTIYKLRTMPTDAEAASGPVWTKEDDARRTRVGAFLRRWNLDELPQFWNVLRGDMSLVGPRPERPHFVEQFKNDVGHYMTRHVSRPGITGWAQVNGMRGDTSIHDRVHYDLYYLENWSLSFDFKILLQTFLHNENAY
jgi:exopolysaccharide biosynthesis polyprenyl glycosylphosphotransferase